MAGLRHRRQGYFVQIPRETIRNRKLSYKVRGLLGYILDMPPGWEPTIEKLVAASDDDGSTAVSSGLQKLRMHGYLRLERRKRLDGTFEWGAAVSEVPVPSWAAENAVYDGKPIPLMEQPDGTFRVRMPDGSLAPDGFEDAPERDDDPTGLTAEVVASSQVRPEVGFPQLEDPLTGNPLTGNPSTENPGVSTKELTTRDASSLRSDAASRQDAAPRRGLSVVHDSDPPLTVNQRVDRLLKGWWDERKANRPHTLPIHGFKAIRGLVHDALEGQRPEALVAGALDVLADGATPFTRETLQKAIREVAGRPGAPEEFRPFAGEDPPWRQQRAAQGNARSAPNSAEALERTRKRVIQA